MPWESKLEKSDQSTNTNKNIAETFLNDQARSVGAVDPKSVHVADPFFKPFLNDHFDPADYLNSNLPSLSRSKSSQAEKDSVPLNQLSPLAQTVVSQLNANTARLTTILTQLTDEILRSGSRLAYEVEILRGNTLNLSEVLTEVLHDDLEKFKSTGLDNNSRDGNRITEITSNTTPDFGFNTSSDQDPPFIRKLRILTSVRSQLEAVVKIINDAIEWSFPPSEVSTASSFLSLSGPDTGSGIGGSNMEDKGQLVSRKLRSEISELLNGDDPINGIKSAAKRVQDLKDLATVWKGTAEERARLRFVESLAKIVNDRHKEIQQDSDLESRTRSVAKKYQEADEEVEESKLLTGYGIISQLQKLRGS